MRFMFSGEGKTNISTELFLLCLAFDLQKFFSKLQCENLIFFRSKKS